ncbi:hypothetical protein I545_3728 [Mycobacterium kansasii 662]|uniref:Uncharacterized protein n=2 Tax=Mycobacterium kansasii TaxID=1768 RepID=A0A1V3X371_MYCKA|nr:hypothetical protein I547_5491 [Mycobacterium kansasii 824]EUA16756.1 hypothetical protein I545_3728 [Mycobacterium kansasii 662]KEP41667.1 hypothetical protein MKSMC1_31370 [Mycobacterium kansasii]OOK73517.1 hypothetical protein BZL30_5036 [Mycobacterium kansasii]OOK76889.1 hypothetical protein BZL29_3755 [Mycobacterium kansasii]
MCRSIRFAAITEEKPRATRIIILRFLPNRIGPKIKDRK